MCAVGRSCRALAGRPVQTFASGLGGIVPQCLGGGCMYGCMQPCPFARPGRVLMACCAVLCWLRLPCPWLAGRAACLWPGLVPLRRAEAPFAHSQFGHVNMTLVRPFAGLCGPPCQGAWRPRRRRRGQRALCASFVFLVLFLSFVLSSPPAILTVEVDSPARG